MKNGRSLGTLCMRIAKIRLLIRTRRLGISLYANFGKFLYIKSKKIIYWHVFSYKLKNYRASQNNGVCFQSSFCNTVHFLENWIFYKTREEIPVSTISKLIFWSISQKNIALRIKSWIDVLLGR